MNLAYQNVTPIRPELQAVERRVVDTDNGYTRIANELLEAIASADLTARQLKLMLAYVRKTYGFNKKMDRIADEQISQLTGLSRQNVNKVKKELISMNCLIVEGSQIGINKEVSAWRFSKCLQVSNFVSKPETHKRHYSKDKKDNNSMSENSGESSDSDNKNKIVLRDGAAVQTTSGNKWGTDDDLKTAEWIFSRVRKVSPTAKQPTWASWANDIRLLRDSLEISHQEICRVFNWANKDQFWQTNILSPSKLRKQWDTLSAKMLQQPNHSPSHSAANPEPHWNSKESWEDVI